MAIDFHRDMDRYLTSKNRKRLFSDFKSKIMNKKAVVSYKAGNKFGELKGKLVSKVGEIKERRQDPEKDISREDINNLIEKKGIKREKIESMPLEEEGWKEVKIERQEEKNYNIADLDEKKRKLQESLAKINEKKKSEKDKLVKLGVEKVQREKTESEQDKRKRLELEEDIKVLKEKERIEEDRLAELKKARRMEQMDSLKGRVTDILFKKRAKISKDMAEEVRREVRQEAKAKEAERQRIEANKLGRPKEDVTKNEDIVPNSSSSSERSSEPIKQSLGQAQTKPEEEKTKSTLPNLSNAMGRIFGREQQALPKVEKKEEPVKQKAVEKKKPKKPFFSNFIQIKTAEQIAKEEREMLKKKEKQALKDQSVVNDIFGQDKVEIKTDIPQESQSTNLSTLFQEDTVKQEAKLNGDTIELDQNYKIKVVKN